MNDEWPSIHDLPPTRGATKNDRADKKPRLDLIDPKFVAALGEVLRHGAEKYGAWNWLAAGADGRVGKEWSRDYAAALRHMFAWWGGEDIDPESGLPHLHHAATDLMLVSGLVDRGVGVDDRPSLPPRRS